MTFAQAVSKRIYELCDANNITTHKLAEISIIPPSTLQGITSGITQNPSSVVIYQICKPLKITIKDFFDSELFSNLVD